MGSILASISERWLSTLRVAANRKKEQFGIAAAEAMRFYSKPHSFMYDEWASAAVVGSKGYGGFKATANLVSNMVQVFLPVLYHRNPVRTVTPRTCTIPPQLMAAYGMLKLQSQDPTGAMFIPQPNSPYMATEIRDRFRAALIEKYLNITPTELDLKGEAKSAITETLIKGMSLLWPTVYEMDGVRTVGSEWVSVDDLLIDPDARTLREAKFIARLRRRAAVLIEQEFGLEPGTVKGSSYTTSRVSEVNANTGNQIDSSDSAADQVEYYEVYSRFGLGGKLGMSNDENTLGTNELDSTVEPFGPYVWLCICEDVNFPLNLPESLELGPEVGMQEQMQARVQWPIPYYKDLASPWPFADLSFHDVPGQAWPMAHITPAMGYQKAIDWIFSYMMGRIKIASRTFFVVPKDLEEDVKNRILYGDDMELLEIEASHPGTMDKICQFLQTPNVAQDIWTVLAAIQSEFEKATGMVPLLYGNQPTQDRSAATTQAKQTNLSVRPDDMANIIEDWMAVAARKEAIAARLLLRPEDVAPRFGEQYAQSPAMQTGMVPGMAMGGVPQPPQYGPLTQAWSELVATTDVDECIYQNEYRIESNSARKPDKAREVANINESAQVIVPALMTAYQGTGDPTAVNAWLQAWAKSRDMDASQYVLPDMRQQVQQMQMQAMMLAADKVAKAEVEHGLPTGQPLPVPGEQQSQQSQPPQMGVAA